MNKLKANRYQQAIKEVEELDKSQLSSIQEEINEVDADYFHVAMVRISDRPGQVKNDVSVVVQKFNEQAFRRFEKNFAFQGFTKIIIVHDPTNNSKSLTIDSGKQGNADTRTQAEIDAEIEEKANAKANQLFQDKLDKEKADSGKQGDQGDLTKNDDDAGKNESTVPNPFENGDTVKAMTEFANTHKIELSGLRKQGEIKAVLISWQNEQIKEQTN